METFAILDEDSIEITLQSPLITAEVQGKITVTADIVIDKLATKTPLSESSTYLIVQRFASEPILKFEIVSATGTTTVKLAHNNTTADDAFVVGMALNDANTGEKVDVLIMGVVSDPSFAVFGLNATLFLDVDGGITDIKPVLPAATSTTILGRSFGSGDVFVNVQRPTFLT